MLCTKLNSDRLPFFKLGYTMNPNHILVFFFFSKTKQLDHMSIWFKWNEFSSYIRGFLAVRYEGESISNQPNLFPVEIHNFLSSFVMHLDHWCSSAISPELKKSGSFPLTQSSNAVTTSSSDRKWHPRISFFRFGIGRSR